MSSDFEVLRDRIGKLQTPAACERFALNVEANGKPEVAALARKRAIKLCALSHGAVTAAEREALEAVYAYEQTLFEKHGRRVRANRTWRMIKSRGIIPAVERVVTRSQGSAGYTALCRMGLQDMAFEAVVLRYPTLFTRDAVRRSRERLGV